MGRRRLIAHELVRDITKMPKLAIALVLMTTSVSALAHAPAGDAVAIPADLAVPVVLDGDVSSKAMRVGDRFAVTVARDVVRDGQVVVPRGTRGIGSVVWRTGRGAFGRSAKMEIAVTSLTIGGQVVPMTGRFREHGDGNTAATVGTILVGGLVAGAFVTGHSAVFEKGRELNAFTAAPVMTAIAPAGVPARPAVASPVYARVPQVMPTAPGTDSSLPSTVFAQRLAAARPIVGRDPQQGWTISD